MGFGGLVRVSAVWGLGFDKGTVRGLGFRGFPDCFGFQGFEGFRVYGFGFRVWGSCRSTKIALQGVGVQGFGRRVWGSSRSTVRALEGVCGLGSRF